MRRKTRAWLGVGLAAACLSGCAVVNRMSGMSRVYELQASGQPAEGTILEIWDTQMTLNDDPIVGFRLKVRPENGEPFEATTKGPIPVIHIPQFQPGAVVPVLYDQNDRTRVALDIYEHRKKRTAANDE